VQFHPESILTLGDDLGLRLIRNVVAQLSEMGEKEKRGKGEKEVSRKGNLL
jgi:hypothetical protein